jgi:hypothetical protein
MTIRKSSSAEALRALSMIAAKLDICPVQHAGATNGPAQDAICSVQFRDPVFCSPWWGHATGSFVGGTLDPAACLTGAYGEMIENVSCDLWYPDWLPCRREIKPLWDEDLISSEQCAESLPRGSGVRHTVESCPPAARHRVHPYANVTNPADRILFPREIGLEVSGRNNGGAVGSEPCEAIVTGLFEIFERYVLGKFALRTERFPLINPNVFESKRAGRIATFLKANGHETLYLDMSLGGRLPVVGVLLLNPALDVMSLAVAGSHSLQEAVEHCLREMLSDEYYRDRLVGWPTGFEAIDLVRAWARSGFTVGWGGSLAQIDFARGYSEEYKRAFDEHARDNAELLRRSVAICRGFGSEVYARDCSILGVSSFHVYASVLSENLFVAHEGLLSQDENARMLAAISRDRWLRDYLPILDQCSAGEFSAWTTLGRLLDNPFIGYPEDEDVCDYFNWPVAPARGPAALWPEYRGVSLMTLVAGLAYHAGDFAKAAALWRRATTLKRPAYDVVGHFLDLAATSPDLSAAKRDFVASFGESRLAEVEHEMSIASLIRIPLRPGDTDIEQRWQCFRDRIYPRRGQWRAEPFELGG